MGDRVGYFSIAKTVTGDGLPKGSIGSFTRKIDTTIGLNSIVVPKILSRVKFSIAQKKEVAVGTYTSPMEIQSFSTFTKTP